MRAAIWLAPPEDEWRRASVAEFDAADAAGDGLSWSLGVLNMSIGHAITSVFFPWTRKQGETPAFGAAAVLGALFAAVPAYILMALILDDFGFHALLAPIQTWLQSENAENLAPFMILGGLGLAAWVNFGAMTALSWTQDEIGGGALLFKVRPRIANLMVFALAAGLLGIVALHFLSEAFVYQPH